MKTIKEMIIAKEGVTVEIAKYINGEIKLEDEGISSAGQMRPDTICIDDSGIYIIDSKFCSKPTLKRFP